MASALHIDQVVERLEASLMPRFAEFARATMWADDGVVAQVHSNRHHPLVHTIGVSCRPVGTDPLEPTMVALAVNAIALAGQSLKAVVVWQGPPLLGRTDAETACHHDFSERTVANFVREVLSLLPVLSESIRRGRPAADSALGRD